MAAPVYYGEEIDANSGGDGVIAEEHYGEEAPANRETIEVDSKVLSFLELPELKHLALLEAISNKCFHFFCRDSSNSTSVFDLTDFCRIW